MPKTIPYVLPDSAVLVADSSQKIRLAWVPIKGANVYWLSVFNAADKSLIVQKTVENPFVDLELKSGAYLWDVVGASAEGAQRYSVEAIDGLRKIYVFGINELDSYFESKQLIGVTPLGARKDTKLLDPVWGNLATEKEWNQGHLDHEKYDAEESWRCWAVGANMLNHYYGGTMTQDEIKIHGMKLMGHSPLLYFAHGSHGGVSESVSHEVLRYIFGEMPEKQEGMPGLKVLQEMLLKENPDPIYVSVQFKSSRHVMVVDGYAVLKYDLELSDGALVAKKGDVFFHFLNRDNNGSSYWMPATSFDYAYYMIAKNRNHVGMTNFRVHQDSDGDGVYDYDEEERFHSDPYNVDSDGDGITDFDEIYAFVERCVPDEANGCLAFAYYDSDGDGLPTYLDKDSDNGGTWDGDERERNSDPFDASDDTTQSSSAVVMSEWDAPADITLYSLDAMRVNDQTVCYDGNGFCKIASESSRIDFAINVGVQSVVGEIFSRGGVWLRSFAQVNGDVSIYSQPVQELSARIQQGATLTGVEKSLKYSEWPYSVYDRSKNYSISGFENAEILVVKKGEEKTLKNGDVYASVQVESGGILKLEPGEIRIRKIQFETGSSIEFTSPGQKTVVWSDEKILWKASIKNNDLEKVARGFKLIQLSDKDLFIEGDWAGTIHAANASLIMGQTQKRMFGRFVARLITIHQNSLIYRVDFDPIVSTLELVLR